MLAEGGSRARGRIAAGLAVLAGVLLAAIPLGGATAAALAQAPALDPAPAFDPAPALGPAATAPTPGLAVIVPITAPPDATGLLGAEALAEYTAAPGGLLTRQLDAVAGTRALLAIDPMIPASIRLLGTDVPASATSWLARLEALPNERFALAYADADPALLVRSTAARLLEPTGFGFAIDPARFAAPAETPAAQTPAGESPAPSPSPDAAPTPEPIDAPLGPPPIPTAQGAVALDGALDGILWPRAGSLAEQDVAALAPAALVLADTDLAAPVSGAATVAGSRVLVVDTAATAAVLAAARTLDDDAWSAATAEAAAALEDADGRTVIVGLGRLDAATAPRLAATLAALTGTGAAHAVEASALLAPDADAPEAALAEDGGPDAERLAAIDRRVAAEADAAAFATAVADPALIADRERLTTLALASQGWSDADAWGAAVAEAEARVATLLSSVRIVESSFQFFADRSVLPVAIQNDGDQDVELLVTADPRTGLLDIDPAPIRVTVPAASQATVEIEATAVSNGAVAVAVTMRSTAGVLIGAQANADVNVQAGWETPIVAAAVAALALLLVVGIVRTVRRNRRGGAADDTDAAGGTGEAARTDGTGGTDG